MPRPSSYVDPSVNSFSPSAGVCVGDHVRIHHEAAGRDDHGRRPHHPGLVEGAPGDTDHGAGVVGDQVGRAGLVARLDLGLVDPGTEQVHHDLGALGVTGHRHLVATRGRHGLVAVGPDLLVAGEHQPLGPGLDHRLAGEVGALELEAQRLQPVEVLDRALAVGADLVVLGLLGRRDEVLVHLLGRVLVAGRLLHRRTAAEVEVPAGHARRTAVHRGSLEQQHPSAGARRLEGGAAAGDAEPHHHDVVRRGVGGQLGRGQHLGECCPLALGHRSPCIELLRDEAIS